MPLDIKEYINNYYAPGNAYDYDKVYHQLIKKYQQPLVDFFLNKYENLGYITIIEDNIIINKHFECRKKINLCLNFPRINESFYNRFFFSMNNDHYTLYEAYKHIISSCKKELKICSPFIDYSGISILYAEFISLLAKDVKIYILYRDDNDINNIKYLFSRYGHLIYFRKFHQRDELGLSSIHAKIIIADGKLCYIGSGELRKNSLVSNFELGVVIEDMYISADVERAFDLIYKYSEGE